MLLSALEANGLTMQDVRVHTLTVDDHLAAFQAGEVDALVTFEPVKSQAVAAGGTSIFDSRAIPGRIVDVLAVRSDVGEARPHDVGVLVDAWFAAQSAVASDPAGTAKVMAPRSWVSPEDYRAAVATIRFPDREENRRLLGGASPGLAAPARELAGLLVRGGRLPAEPSVEGLFGGPFVGAP
jgi:NitT/TauT family transport system substrate-binding protein